MDPDKFRASSAGRYIKTVRGYWAFLPNPLPPEVEYDNALTSLLSRADRLLGELTGTGRALQNPYLLISPYTHREAVSSSRIEGTQSSLSDLFFYEASEAKETRAPDVKEVLNYVRAMEEGLKLLNKLPISSRLVCELHAVLMKGVRGAHGAPGELRRTQNWIGPPGCVLNEAAYVPPPAEEMGESLSSWEKYLNSTPAEPVLIQCALMHYQFEAIHPFLDGNGRVGRLLITLLLCQKGALTQPLLYLSEFFDQYRDEYYSRLLAVSQKSDWKGWFEFFLRGVIMQAENALENSRRILDLHARYRHLVETGRKVPKSAHRLIDEIFIIPVVSIAALSRKWGIPFNSVKTGVLRLEKLGILRETTGRRKNRMFVATELMQILTKEEA